MVKWISAGAVLASALGGATQAKDAFHWPVPASQSGASTKTYFPMGTPVAFRTRTEVNTKQSKPGDRLYLEVAESLTYRGQVVLPVGSPAVAEVVRSERKGHFGKKGKIEIRLLHVQTPYGPVRLTGQANDDGKGAGIWSIGGTALVAWPLAFIHGTSGYLRHGTSVTGYLADSLVFTAQPVSSARSMTAAQPDDARRLPATFDPGVFGGSAQQARR